MKPNGLFIISCFLACSISHIPQALAFSPTPKSYEGLSVGIWAGGAHGHSRVRSKE
jgi:hypothetical protein